MPYTFGLNAGADSAWLRFINRSDITHQQRRQWLKSGWLPVVPRAPDPQYLWKPPGWTDQPVHLLTMSDPEYPPQLAACDDAPPVIFVVGRCEILSLPSVAVVGTRNPSADGRRSSRNFSSRLAAAGLVVVSGLARGIDGEAHSATIGHGRTVAVMATGIDQIYPRRHQSLAAQIITAGGAVITEFPPGFGASRWHFPRRNRTISGLALGTLVVEAGRPSGSLLTATAAAEQGREVYALPWSIYHSGGEGCLYLLGDGAQLARTPEDILESLRAQVVGQLLLCAPGPEDALPATDSAPASRRNVSCVDESAKSASLDHLGSKVTNLLGDGELTLADLLALTGEPVIPLRQTLATLEISGLVMATAHGYRVQR